MVGNGVEWWGCHALLVPSSCSALVFGFSRAEAWAACALGRGFLDARDASASVCFDNVLLTGGWWTMVDVGGRLVDGWRTVVGSGGRLGTVGTGMQGEWVLQCGAQSLF